MFSFIIVYFILIPKYTIICSLAFIVSSSWCDWKELYIQSYIARIVVFYDLIFNLKTFKRTLIR